MRHKPLRQICSRKLWPEFVVSVTQHSGGGRQDWVSKSGERLEPNVAHVGVFRRYQTRHLALKKTNNIGASDTENTEGQKETNEKARKNEKHNLTNQNQATGNKIR